MYYSTCVLFFLQQLYCDLLADISTCDSVWEKDIALDEFMAAIFCIELKQNNARKKRKTRSYLF